MASPNSNSSLDKSIVNAIIQNQNNANTTAFNLKYDPGNSPALFQSDPSLEKMPNSVIQQIKCKICPAPLGPEVANAQLTSINNTIQKQADIIELLENKVSLLEARYKIKIQMNKTIVTTDESSLTVGGTLSDVLLDFSLNTPLQGPIGNAGTNGLPGPIGKMGPKGIQGPTGYWGNME
jgi:hypothetical protein